MARSSIQCRHERRYSARDEREALVAQSTRASATLSRVLERPAVADVNNGNGWHNSAHGLYGRTYQIEPLHTGDPKRRRKICTSLVCRELLAFYVSAA
jgi:hypothetical protein